jgi:hypothetical protein
MPLRNPSQGLATGRQFSPLWRRIQKPFSDSFLQKDGNKELAERLGITERQLAERLYVSARKENGLEEKDLHEHIAADDRNLFLVTAPAGLGKTTFLHHTLDPYEARTDVAFVWINVLEQVIDVLQDAPQDTSPSPPVVQVARLISSALEGMVARPGESTWPWRRFFLEHCVDPVGIARRLRDELDETHALREDSQIRLDELIANSSAYLDELIRLRLHYLWSVGRRPLIVIDNVDQLRARYIDDLARFAYQLASGTKDKQNAARVVFATRMVHRRRMQVAVGTMKAGDLEQLKAADIALIVLRRLELFLGLLDPHKVVPSETLPLPKGGELRVEQWLRAEETPERYFRSLLEVTTNVLIRTRTPYGPAAEFVQKLNHNNMRVTLIVIGQYLASAHLPWAKIYIALAGLPVDADLDAQLEAAQRILRWPTVFHALFVGTRTNLANQSSWLFHLFNDGSNDRIGVLIRSRVLKAIAVHNTGTTCEVISKVLERLFGYPQDRTARVWNDIHEFGLIYEPTLDGLVLSDAGNSYLNDMMVEFEYLQHTLMDAWTDAMHFRAIRPNEDADARADRVLAFADWIRELEIGEYQHVLQADEEELYESYYGTETIARHLCDSLLNTRRISNAIHVDTYRELLAEAQRLRDSSSFERIRADAANRPVPRKGRMPPKVPA